MDESNWWLYLIGAAVAYYFVPWQAAEIPPTFPDQLARMLLS